jgi:hypothetical protein
MPEEAEDAAAAAPQPKAAPPAAAKPAPKAPREIPTQAELARWVAGEELPTLEHLFDQLNTKTFDIKVMQIKKDELLPQHWQVISRLEPPADEEFDRLPEVEAVRRAAGPGEVAKRRVEALRIAWRELRGKRPSLWNAADVFAALRRVIDKKREVAFHDLLSAVRDVWRGLSLPQGREQLEVLWGCLDFIRSKTK